LNNLGITSIACSNTHSAAWNPNSSDVYTWGMSGEWLAIPNAKDKNFGKVQFSKEDAKSPVIKVECANQYTLFLFEDGRVAASGINEHGRMGLGKDISETIKPTYIQGMEPIGEISAGSFHSAFISQKGQIYTCGVGTDFRLGHGNEDTIYEPKLIESLNEIKCVRVECVEDRTFAITKAGCALMWGVEPVSEMVHTAPFVYEYMRPYRIYQICGAKDFTVALGVHAKEPVPKPEIEAQDDVRMKKTYQALNSTIADVINTGHKVALEKGYKVDDVYDSFVKVSKQEKEAIPRETMLNPQITQLPPPPSTNSQLNFAPNFIPPPPNMNNNPQQINFQFMPPPDMIELPPPPDTNNDENNDEILFHHHRI